MTGWWNKLHGSRSTLTAEHDTSLRADLSRLDRVSNGLGERAVRYVLEGADHEVLDVLAASTGGGRALQLKCVDVSLGRGGPREPFFRDLPKQAPSFYLRLALVYEAASRREPRKLILDWVPDSPPWLEIFLWEASNLQRNTWKSDNATFVGFDLVEEMLGLGGASPEIPLRAAFLANPRDFGTRHILDLVGEMDGFAAAATRYPGVVSDALSDADAKRRVHALELLGRHAIAPAPHAPQLVDLAVSSARTVRSAAQALLRLIPDVADPLARRRALDGTPDERGHAADLLWSLKPSGVRAFLEERLASETSPRVRKSIANLLGFEPEPTPGETGDRPAVSELTLAPLAVRPPGRLTESAREALSHLAHEWQRKSAAAALQMRVGNPKWKVPDPPPVTPQTLDRIVAQMEAANPEKSAGDGWAPGKDWRFRLDETDAKRFLAHPDLELTHVVRFLVAVGLVDEWNRGLRQAVIVDRYLRHFRDTHGLSFGLREIAVALQQSGFDASLIGWSRLGSYWQSSFRWEPEAVWPYFVEHLEIVEEALELRPSQDEKDMIWLRPKRQTNALAVLEAFPRMPAGLQPRLWQIALGSAKADRAAAQRCLAKETATIARIVEALQDGKQEVRCAAAAWLADLGRREAVPAIETALQTEKQDVAKAMFMDALEALGAPVDEFLNRPGLAGEAERGLRKGIPAALTWFPFDRLPSVRWGDTGDPISCEVLTWMIIQAHKMATPEPGALLRRYAHQMRASDREDLGRFILEAWIARDTELPSAAEVQAKALQLAQQVLSFYKGKTLQEVAEEMAQSVRNQPKGSAAGDKGVLAVAGACAGPSAAQLTQQYLKTWYGFRAAQCRALLQMLSWVDHPSAIQLVLSTGTRFRTAGIRKEAEKQAQLIAERKGWSLAELADRTIPTAGFDERGELELDYGARRFVARIGGDFGITLSNAEGKSVAALPDARAEDSAELVAAAKKTLSNAKKELKTALKLQRERLYEAMCTQRTWRYEDWDTFLHRHPLVGRYCRQLVWLASRADEKLGTFRPMGDGSLTTARDEPMSIPADACVRIAHACDTEDDEARAWLEQLAAYELEPLFDQFGRTVYRPSDEALQQVRIEDYLGHVLQAFKLRARATKLGYVRGQAEDGGWFFVYRKHFTTLGLEAVIEFTGNGLPEENRTVALRSLYFSRGKDESNPFGPESECTLGEIPAVLLSECWNDLRSIAAEGTGFDPDWEKKVEP